MPDKDSIEHHFKEHELGVGLNRQGRLSTYRVHHPRWAVYPIQEYDIQVDAKGLYGTPFAVLESQRAGLRCLRVHETRLNSNVN